MMRRISPVIRLKPPQSAVFTSEARFRILVAGRRLQTSQVRRLEAAEANGQTILGLSAQRADLRIKLITGGTICLRGPDNYDSLRGDELDFLILDEYASMVGEAWPEVLRPSLADKGSRALFIGTPRGYNHFYDLYQAAHGKPDWATFQFTTEQGGNVPRAELESATHELDEGPTGRSSRLALKTLARGSLSRFSTARKILSRNPTTLGSPYSGCLTSTSIP